MERKQINYCGRTHQGEREVQQDSCGVQWCEQDFLAVVCDGMGGLQSGEYASRYATEQFIKLYRPVADAEIPQYLQELVCTIDKKIYNMEDDKGNCIVAGTTLSAVLIRGEKLYWCSVGDSRIFISRGGQTIPVTREHNYQLYLNDLQRMGKMSEEDYLAESVRGRELISYLGMGNIELIDTNINPFLLQKSDRIFICSDGVLQSLNIEEYNKLINENQSITDINDTIYNIIESSQIKNKDNATYIIIEYKGGQ